jgi:MFS family permease
MQNVGGVWFMTSLSDSAFMVALMQTATSLPVFLVVLPAGALADIVDRRKMLLFTQGWMLVAAAALAAITLMGLTTSWVLLGLTFALGLGSAMNIPAWQAIMPDLVPRKQLSAAIALNGITFNIARATGPALGGAIVAAAGPGAVFLLNALSFLAVIGVIFRWNERHQEENDVPSEHIFEAMRTGMRYVFNASSLKSALIRCWLFVICAGALWALMPLVARRELDLGSTGFGALLACIGVGAIVGAVVLPTLRRNVSLDSLMMAATVLFAMATLALAYARNLALLGSMMVCGGAAWTILMSSFNVAVQTCAPAWVRARVLGFYTLVFQGGLAISSAAWGAVAQRSSLTSALMCAAVGLVFSLVAVSRWRLKQGTELDLRPSLHWGEHVAVVEPSPEDGPVMLTLEYLIDPSKSKEFEKAMRALARVRRRGGATRWGLYRDLSDPGRYVETYTVASWAEHLRQHTRVTVTDRATVERAKDFHTGRNPPAVRHLIHARG